MGSYRIRRLGLEENVVKMLERQNLLSCKDVLSSLTPLEFQTLLGIDHRKAEKLLDKISKKCVSHPETVFHLCLNQNKASNEFFSLSLSSLDLLLQGGLPFGSISEITGPPGVGKTQFCFMLSVIATLPVSLGGADGKVLYIDTESTFSAERIVAMAKKRFPQIFKQNKEIESFLQKILVHKATSVSALRDIVSNIEKDVIQKNIKLIIVDSIASLLRKEYGAASIESIMERNKILLEQAAILKDLAQTYKIVILVTNQITSHVTEYEIVSPHALSEDEEEDPCDFDKQEDFSGSPPPATVRRKKVKMHQRVNADRVIPALGTTWSHCVNTRLVAQFLDPSVRQLAVMKSPVAPNVAVRYIINESGIVLTDDDIEFISMPDMECLNISTKNNFLTAEITGTGRTFAASVSTTKS